METIFLKAVNEAVGVWRLVENSVLNLIKISDFKGKGSESG